MKKLLILMCLLVGVGAAHAAFKLKGGGGVGGGGGGGSANCPYGTGLGDGCDSAATGNYRQSNFFASYAPASGQSYQVATFTGSIAGSVLTTSGVTGTINPNGTTNTLTGAGIPAGTVIANQTGGTTGGAGTYSLTTGGTASSLSIASQSMGALNRPPWNVECVDGTCGYPASSLPLADPATMTTCSGSTVKCLPPGCSYNGTGLAKVNCSGSAADAVFDGFDMTLHGGIGFNVVSTFTGNCTIKNSDLSRGSNWVVALYIHVFAGCKSITFDHVYNNVGSSTGWQTGYFNASAAIQANINITDFIAYNHTVTLDCPARCLSWNSSGSLTVDNAYFDGLSTPAAVFTGTISGGTTLTVTGITGQINPNGANGNTIIATGATPGVVVDSQVSGTTGGDGVYTLFTASTNVGPETMYASSTQHGDGFLINQPTGTTRPTFRTSYSVWTNGIYNSPTNTSYITPSETTDATQILNLWQVDHSVFTSNDAIGLAVGTNQGNMGSLVGRNHAITINTITFSNNFLDCTGSFDAFNPVLSGGSGTPTYTNNKSLVSGGTVTNVSCP